VNMTYNPEAVREAYDKIAVNEDGFEKGFSLRNEVPREFIIKYLSASDIVLDAGGGAGVNAIMMARRCQQVTLVDISPKLLELAAVNIQAAGLTQKIDLVEGDISNLAQFGDAAFSFVVCVGGVLSYALEKGQTAVRELVRVAKQGAILIIGCDSKYGFVRWLLNENESESQLEAALEVYETGEYEAGDGAFARLYTVAELTALLKESGCEIVEVASTPTLVDSWDQSKYPAEKREKLKALELKVCTVPELLGAGHHLLCIARKM
jgi:ubiquinone/menaquinone biosynthesis C-methylase UbiE